MRILIIFFVTLVITGCSAVCQDYTSGVVAKERQNFVLTEAEKMLFHGNIKKLEATLQAQIDAHNRDEWDSYFVSTVEIVTRYALLVGAIILVLGIVGFWATSKTQKKHDALKKLNEELNQKIQAGMEPIRVEMQKLEARKKKQDQEDSHHLERMSKHAGEVAGILARKSEAQVCWDQVRKDVSISLARNAEVAEANIKLIRVGQLVGNFDSAEAKQSIQDLLEALELVKSIKS